MKSDLLGRRTRAAASREAASAVIVPTDVPSSMAALCVPSIVPITTTLSDESYFASPKRKDCKLDTNAIINMELNVCVSIQQAVMKNDANALNKRSNMSPVTRLSPTASKGRRQSPQAITHYFSPQLKSTECVQNFDNSLADCEPLESQPNHQSNNNVSTNDTGRSYNEPPNGEGTQPMTPRQNTAHVARALAVESEQDANDFKSPDATPVRCEVVLKQGTPHRIVITSPVKVMRTTKASTVSEFSQLKIGESPTNKKTATKIDKKSRRR